jgi:hypothetical protein
LSHCSDEVNIQIDQIFRNLIGVFGNPDPSTDEIGAALAVMELITPLSTPRVAQECYNLFQVTMQAPTSNHYPEETKYKASCFAMCGAYQSDEFLLLVADLPHILSCLIYHLLQAHILGF